MNSLKKIVIVGHGNVGSHLSLVLEATGSSLSVVHKRELDNYVFSQDTDLILLCVPDDQIKPVIKKLPKEIAIAYTSGSIRLADLPSRSLLGVFYPLQTFTKDRSISLQDVPFFIESENSDFAQSLFELAEKISTSVQYADSEQRRRMHVSAVWVNNFTNHILHKAKAFSDENKIDFAHFIPLLNETINKAMDITPLNAQTGPARRGDQQTINAHLDLLSDEDKMLYKSITNSIINTYSNEKL